MPYWLCQIREDAFLEIADSAPVALAQAVATWHADNPGRQVDPRWCNVIPIEQALPNVREELGFPVPILPYLRDADRFESDLAALESIHPAWTAADREDLFRLQRAISRVGRAVARLTDSTYESDTLAPLELIGGGAA
ncbi:MAG: hypothetical protein AB7S38_28740 [Vulcanimicrobiota bacterium]